MNLTIIIPTKDRPDYLKQLINYYQDFKFQGKILILDSSTKKNFIKSKSIINSCRLKKNIRHMRLIGRPFECTAEVRSKITTSFVCWSGDDDLFLVSGLIKIIKILKKNTNISGINGLTITFKLKDKLKKKYGFSVYQNFSSEKKFPLERLLDIFKNYKVPVFSIFKTKDFKRMLEYVPLKKNRNICPTRIIHDELLESFLLAFFNKIKFYKIPYLIRMIPPKKFAKPIDQHRAQPPKDLKSFLFIEKIFLRLIRNKNDKIRFKNEYSNFTSNLYNNKKSYKYFKRLKRLIYLFKNIIKKYILKSSKKFKEFDLVIQWMIKN
jgi:glycosyltransferase domain-containing protein